MQQRGSEAERRGYRIFARTLAEHRALLEEHDWERILNYETEWMTRAEIVDATYTQGGKVVSTGCVSVGGNIKA